MLLDFKIKKMMINLRAIFMKRRLRHRYRHIALAFLTYKTVQACKWGVSYSVFDNEEMLEYSIKSIRKQVDYVNVVYQLESWYGNPASENLIPTLNALKKKGLIDELIEYKANPTIKAVNQERNKRNMGLEHAKKAGVNYFMTMDCDEFYIDRELEKAKHFIVKNSITYSYVDIFNYFSPTLRSIYPAVSYVNFFSKITKSSKLVDSNKHSIALVDPTRMLGHLYNSKYYFMNSIAMHHMTMYRKDILKKMTNSTCKQFYTSIPESKGYMKVEDIFTLERIFDDK